MRLTWDDAKRQANLDKHGLDFADAEEILLSRYRLDVPVIRNSEQRVMSLSYVIAIVHTDRDGLTRIISLRRASDFEAEKYYDWLENQWHDPQ